jgi:hypothetical protein
MNRYFYDNHIIFPSNIWEKSGINLHLQPQTGDELLAQLVEHNTFNVGVPGSSPGGFTKTELRLCFFM